MSYSLSMTPALKQAPSLKHVQRLMMSPQMQQALQLLQAPVMELSTLIEKEMEQNPVLEMMQEEQDPENQENDSQVNETEAVGPEKELTFNEHDLEVLLQLDEEYRDSFRTVVNRGQQTLDEEKLQAFLENSITAKPTLFEHLMTQAAEVFEDEELKIAEAVIGNLDEKGFLSGSLQEIAQLNQWKEEVLISVLKTIQTFDPAGVGAANLQEALLLQLIRLGQENTLAYRILKDHYQDLLHNRLPDIQKKLKCPLPEINNTIEKWIAKLDLHPGAQFSKESVQLIFPDLIVEQEGDKLKIVMHEDSIPNLRINRKYLRMLKDQELNPETKEFIQQKILSAKWLMRNVFERNSTLEKIVQAITEKQREFFVDPEGKLIPMTMKEMAEELDLHESTIARAVANKYLHSERGLFPIRHFFTNALACGQGKISTQTVRDVLLQLIKNENKRKPLSDEALAKEIKKSGIDCARRTVAKYRSQLNIGNAHQRKEHG